MGESYYKEPHIPREVLSGFAHPAWPRKKANNKFWREWAQRFARYALRLLSDIEDEKIKAWDHGFDEGRHHERTIVRVSICEANDKPKSYPCDICGEPAIPGIHREANLCRTHGEAEKQKTRKEPVLTETRTTFVPIRTVV